MIPNHKIPINPINPVEHSAHFVEAQNVVYDEVLNELQNWNKETNGWQRC
jgi:hypothetical protein